MHVMQNQAPGETGFPGIEHVTLAGSANGLRHLSIWQQSVAPGAATPLHRHECEEVVLCTAGEGELHVNGTIERFGANTTVVIPANVDHQILSVGERPLAFVAVLGMTPVEVQFPDGAPIALPWPT